MKNYTHAIGLIHLCKDGKCHNQEKHKMQFRPKVLSIYDYGLFREETSQHKSVPLDLYLIERVEHGREISRSRKCMQADFDTRRIRDEGNKKCWADGRLSKSVDLIRVTLCDRKLVEEMAQHLLR